MRRGRMGLVAACLIAAASCGGGEKSAEEAEPLQPQPYGTEETNVELWLENMEVGSRELYSARNSVVEALGLTPGARVADIGAGTGLYTLLFAPAVGEDGFVFAVDIEPRFLKLINQRVGDLDIDNVQSVLSREDNATLPPDAIDVAFVADTYHYFSDPAAMLASIRSALRDKGRLVIVDYFVPEDDAATDGPSHLRFDKAGLVSEVEANGFQLIAEPDVEGLSEFYFLVFEKA